MKSIFMLFCLIPVVVRALDAPQLEGLLATAAPSQSNAYVVARDEIVALGSNALPSLATAAQNENLSWQQRMVARICFERIAREGELKSLLAHDWNTYPPYQNPGDPKYGSILGGHIYMGEYVIPRCKDARLWYYYLEQTWKKTGEAAQIRPRRDPKFEASWPSWCRKALEGQPEESYMTAILCDRLRNNPELTDRRDRDLYGELLGKKDASTVPALVDLYPAYSSRELKGPELFPGRHSGIYLGMFAPILDFADASHAGLLEKFMDEHPQLAQLKPKLADVRARPASTPKPEPPFRLGTNLVVRPNP